MSGHSHTIHLRSTLHGVDACDLPAIFGALAADVGLAGEVMEKAAKSATPPRGMHPFYPELEELARRAVADWRRWGEQLVDAVMALEKEGRLRPFTTTTERALGMLFRRGLTAIVGRLTGRIDDPDEWRLANAYGLTPDAIPKAPPISIAFGIGVGTPTAARRAAPERGDAAKTLDAAERKLAQLTPKETLALEYAQARAGIYIRRPVAAATGAITRELELDELERIRGAVGAAVRERATAQQLKVKLREAMVGTSLTNDLDRIVRTELAHAHNFGAYQRMKNQIAGAGITNPRVYKIIRPGACSDCLRIWGKPSAPRHYALSEIEAWEADGGNFQKPREKWQATIGPIHPNCTEGPLQVWNAALFASAVRGLKL